MADLDSTEARYQATSDKTQDQHQPLSSQGQEHEYQETQMTDTVPTKTGDEHDQYSDAERPVSQGTATGTDYDFDQISDDESFIARNSANAGTGVIPSLTAVEPAKVGDFFARPNSSDGLDIRDSFHFSKPDPQQMQFQTNHKHTNTVVPQNSEPVDGHSHDHGISPAIQIKDIDTHISIQDLHASVPSNEIHAEHSAPPLLDGERKRKKKKVNLQPRQQQHLVEEVLEGVVGSNTADQRPETAVDGVHTPNEHAIEVEPEAMGTEPDLDTGDYQAVQNHRHSRDSSPHEQLQYDLDAAAQNQQRRTEGSSTTLAHGSQDNGCGNQIASPVADIQSTAQQHDSGQETIRRVDDRSMCQGHGSTVAPRGQKKKSKSSRRTTSAPQATSGGGHEWALGDYANLLVLKAQESAQASQAAFAAELEALQLELEQTVESRSAIQSSLDSTLSEKQELFATTTQQKRKIAHYESKFQNFKKFMDGIGKDFDALKKNANTLRTRSDDVMSEIDILRTKSTEIDKVDTRVENCSRITRDAVKVAREKDDELHRTALHRDTLQKQLSDTVGVLSEQRDRCAKLESQLQESEKKLVNSMKTNQANHDALVDKLHLIHASIEDEQSKDDTVKMIEQLRAATEAVSAPADSTAQDVAGMKALIEALDEKLNSNIEVAEAAEIGLRQHFEEALKALSAQLADRDKLIGDHHDVVSGLQEQLNACSDRAASAEAQKSAALEQVGELREQNATLQTKVSALQSKISPAENAQVQLNEAKLELEKTVRVLSSTKSDLDNKAEELNTLALANTSLEDHLKALQNRLHELQSGTNESPSDEELASKIRDTEERTRKEMAAHFENFEMQLKTKSNNELKKLNSEKVRLEKQVKPLQDELTSYRQKINAIQAEKPPAAEAMKQELERTKKHNQLQKSELESLHSTIKDLKKSSVDSKAVQEKLSAISTQLDAEKSKHQHACERNSELQEQVKQLEDAQEEMQAEKEQKMEELSVLRSEGESRVATLQEDLEDAKENASRCTAGLENFKKSCDDAIKAANNDNERKLQAVQKQLSETQAELQSARNENETFFEGVEQSWKDEQESWRKKVAEATKKTAELEASKAEAQTRYESLIQQLRTDLNEQRNSMHEENEQLKTQLQEAQEKIQTHQRPSSNQSKASSRIQVPRIGDGKTPSKSAANATSRQPRAPRKIVDRSKGEVTSLGPIQAPEEIRPDSRRTNSANSKATVKGPLVEETQFVSDPFAATQANITAAEHTQNSFSSLINDDNIGGRDEPASPIIPETQLSENLPTFAAFNNSLRPRKANGSYISSTSNDLPAARHTSDLTNSGRPAFDIIKSGGHSHLPSDQAGFQPARASSNLHLQPWTHEEKMKYTYQPPVPQSNSASKRAPTPEAPMKSIKRRESGGGSRAHRYKTPTADAPASNTFAKQMPSSSHNGSSPAFIKDASSRRFTTYSTPGNSGGKRRASHSDDTGLIQDPRLIGREQMAGVKRKATGQIVEGYEEERRKRMATNAGANNDFERRTRPQHPQSINDLPTSSQRATRRSSQTHMQTFAGGNSRTTKRMGRGQSADEMSARFSQELQRRR